LTYLVFTSQAEVDAFSSGIDADFGYPLPNVVCPGGVRVARGQTTRYTATLKHRTLSQWAYREDPVVAGKEARVPIGTATRQALDATWADATSNFRAVEPDF